jgi:hypothetical protein
MMSVCSGSGTGGCCKFSRYRNGRFALAGFVLAGILWSGSESARPQTGGRIGGPSGGQVAGAAIGVGAAVGLVTFLAINHGHRSLTGCVFNGVNGLMLKSDDAKVYRLEGQGSNIKANEKVKVHGSKVKMAKGGAGDSTFSVEKLINDYGVCKGD